VLLLYCILAKRASVKGGKHNFTDDGVVFYDKDMLSGYAALFRHPNDALDCCAYLIPDNPKVTSGKPSLDVCS